MELIVVVKRDKKNWLTKGLSKKLLFRNEAIAELFTGTTDAIYIMKWKDIFQTSEKILDQCDDVAKIIGSLVVKQA